MIVKNKDDVINASNALANRMIDMINADISLYKGEDDPVEILYFVMHALGNINARIRIFLESSASLYGMQEAVKSMNDWLTTISNEYYDINCVYKDKIKNNE